MKRRRSIVLLFAPRHVDVYSAHLAVTHVGAFGAT
jgi:hypothetical protein